MKTSFKTGLTNGLQSNANMNGGYISSNRGVIIDADNKQHVEQTQTLIFKYLNQFGRTTVVTKPTLGTINNLPVKLDIVNSVDYVYNIEQSSTNAGVSGVDNPVSIAQTFKPEIKTVTTGFSLVVHPKLEKDFIKIAIKNITSNLNGLTPYTYGKDNENVIMLKDVSAREFDETVKIKEGEIAIIGGYMYTKKHSLKNGLPYTNAEDSALDPLTSAKENEKEKVEIVITISASVI